MNPESANYSVVDKYTDCPIPMTHRRLAAAHLLWHQTLEHYHDSESFLANLNSTIEALRNVTFVLQKEQAVPDFAAWYGKWQAALRENAAAKWLQGARTRVVHQGELESQSTAEVRLITWQDHVLARVAVPAATPSRLILQGLPLLSLVDQSGAHAGDVRDAIVAVERRWSAEGLDGQEILEVLAGVYGVLSDIVLEAHTLLELLACIPEESQHPDFRWYLFTGLRAYSATPSGDYTECRMRPGKNDRRHQVLITGAELRELKLSALPESFGLESRVQCYQGKRPLGLYRWDLDCLLATLSLEMEDRPPHPRLRRKDLAALRSLHDRLRAEYDSAYGRAVY